MKIIQNRRIESNDKPEKLQHTFYLKLVERNDIREVSYRLSTSLHDLLHIHVFSNFVIELAVIIAVAVIVQHHKVFFMIVQLLVFFVADYDFIENRLML